MICGLGVFRVDSFLPLVNALLSSSIALGDDKSHMAPEVLSKRKFKRREHGLEEKRNSWLTISNEQKTVDLAFHT